MLPGDPAQRRDPEGRARPLARGNGRDHGDHRHGREGCARSRTREVCAKRERRADDARATVLAPSSIATRRCSTRATGTACARSSSDDCRLDLVSKSQRRGQGGRRCTSDATRSRERARCASCGSKGGSRSPRTSTAASEPSYFILLACEDGRVRASATSATCPTSPPRPSSKRFDGHRIESSPRVRRPLNQSTSCCQNQGRAGGGRSI